MTIKLCKSKAETLILKYDGDLTGNGGLVALMISPPMHQCKRKEKVTLPLQNSMAAV